MFSRDKSARFKEALVTPGPGEYDPNFDFGYKADMVSGFKGSGRFKYGLEDSGSGSMSTSPRRLPPRHGMNFNRGHGFGSQDSTANRIKELEFELKSARQRIMELQAIIKEANLSPEDKGKLQVELKELRMKLSTQKSLTSHAQKEKDKLGKDIKKLEKLYAHALEKVKKTEDARKLSNVRISEMTTKVEDLVKKLVQAEKRIKQKEIEHFDHLEKLKKGQCEETEAFINEKKRDFDDMEQALEDHVEMIEIQQDQITALENEIEYEKELSEKYAVRNLNDLIWTKVEFNIANDQALDNSRLIDTLQAEVDTLKKLVECLTVERDELIQHLKTCQEDNVKKMEKIKELQKLISDLQAQLEAKDSLVSQMDQKISDYARMDDENKTLLKNTELEIEQLRVQLDDRNKIISQLEDDVYFLKASIESKDGEIQGLKKDLAVTDSSLKEGEIKITSLMRTSENQIKEIEGLTEKLENEISEKKAKVQEIEKQRKEEKSLRCNLSDKERMVNDLTKLLDASEKKLMEEQANRSILQDDLKAARLQLSEKTEELLIKAEDIENLDDKLQKITEESTSKSVKIEELMEDVAKKKLENERSHDLVQKLQHSMEQLEKTVEIKNEEIAVLNQEMSHIKLESEKLQLELNESQLSLDLANDKILAKNSEIQTMESEIEILSGKLVTSDIFNSILALEIKEMSNLKLDLENQIISLKLNFKLSEEKVGLMDGVIRTLKDEKKQLEDDCATNKEEIKKMMSEKSELERSLEEARACALKLEEERVHLDNKFQVEIGKMEKEARENEIKLNEVKEEKKKLAESLKSLNQEIQEKEKALKEIEENFDIKKKENQNLTTEVRELQRKIQLMEANLKEKNAMVSNLEKELVKNESKYSEKLVTLQRDNVEIKEKLEEKENKMFKLDMDLTSMKQDNEDKVKELSDMQATHETTIRQMEMEAKQNLDKLKKKYEGEVKNLKANLVQHNTGKGQNHTHIQFDNSDADYVIQQLKQELADAKNRISGYENNDQHNYKEEVIDLRIHLENALKREANAVNLLEQYQHSNQDKEEHLNKEMQRLTQENILLVSKTEKLNADLKNLINASKYGHHNTNQKIQYHLKLKQELEEMRRQCTVHIKEKFKLEQAIRYMHARTEMLLGNSEMDVSGTHVRNPLTAISQSSTKTNVTLATPYALNQLKWASRSKNDTDKNHTPYKSREEMVEDITETQIEMTNQTNALLASVNNSEESTALNEKDDSLALTLLLTPTSMSSPAETNIINRIKKVIGDTRAKKSKFLDPNTTSF